MIILLNKFQSYMWHAKFSAEVKLMAVLDFKHLFVVYRKWNYL